MRWLRRLAVLLAIALLILGAARLAVAGYAERRLAAARAALEGEVGSLDLAALRPPAVAGDENAARWIEEAIAEARLGVRCATPAAPACAHYEAIGSLGELRAGDWSADTLARAESLLRSAPRLPSLLARIAASPASDFDIDYERGWAAEIPDLLPLFRLARLVAVVARAHLVAGRLDDFALGAAAEAGIARALCGEPTLLTQILGGGVERLHLALVADHLARGPTDERLLHRLAADLERGRCGDSLRRGLEAEAMLLTSTPPDVLRSAALAERLPFAPWHRLAGFVSAPAESLMVAAALEARTAELGALDLPYTEYRALHAEGAFRPRFLSVIYDITAPHSQAAVGKAKATETSRILARGALELALVRLGEGGFPATFELPATPYAGEAPLYGRDEGRAELSTLATAELFAQHLPGIRESTRPIFRWRVAPPPTGGQPAGGGQG